MKITTKPRLLQAWQLESGRDEVAIAGELILSSLLAVFEADLNEQVSWHPVLTSDDAAEDGTREARVRLFLAGADPAGIVVPSGSAVVSREVVAQVSFGR